MRTLVSLLEGAAQRSASEVALESGQPVVYTTASGREVESAALPRTELFDMIVAAVDDNHQVDLAIGNPVEFRLDAGGTWMVSAMPGKDGFTVHARREGGVAVGLEIDLDYTEPGPPPNFEFEEPQFDVGLDRESASTKVTPRPPGASLPSQLHVEALDAPSLEDSGEFTGPALDPAPAAPFESGTWALDDDDDVDVGLGSDPSEDSLPTGFDDSPFASDGHIGVPDDDDDDDPFGDPESPPPVPSRSSVDARRTLSPTVRAMEAREPGPETSPGETRRDLGKLRSPDADTHRELPSVGSGEIELGFDIGEGTLVYVRETGLAEVIAQTFQAPSFTIDDSSDPPRIWKRVCELPPGSLLIVRCEDPSPLLSGILRRLEEGYRVFVETRARTSEGARRVLLGVSATDRAERWLDAQVALTLEPGENGPSVVPS